MDALLLYVLLCVACAVVSSVIAYRKGRSVGGWFLLSLVFGVLALIVVACLPSRRAPLLAGAEPVSDETHCRCPACRELIRRDATKCRYCGEALTPTPPERRRSALDALLAVSDEDRAAAQRRLDSLAR